MHRLYVIAFPEMAAPDAGRVEALRAAHDPQGHAMLRAHFTFVFGCGCVSAAVAENAMRSVAAAVAPVGFCLSRAILSQHGDLHYVFLCPDRGATGLRRLHDQLHTGPLARCLDPSQQFTPHLTVCKTVDGREAGELVDKLNRRPLRVEGAVRALTLGFVADGEFKAVARAALGRPA